MRPLASLLVSCGDSIYDRPFDPKHMRFFNLDLHISVIADVKNIFESLGHNVESWSISGHDDFQGVVHFPYQISTMSIFEEYTANVPLFFPTKQFLATLQTQYPHEILSELSFHTVRGIKPPVLDKTNPNIVGNPQVLLQWIDFADFYDQENMPFIRHFDSISDLEDKLKSATNKEISDNMRRYNKKRHADAYQKWEKILQDVAQVLVSVKR